MRERRCTKQGVHSVSFATVLFLLLVSAPAVADVWTYTPYRTRITTARLFYLEKPVSDTEIRIFRAEKTRGDWKKTVLVHKLRTDAVGELKITQLPKDKYFLELTANNQFKFLLLLDFRGGNKKRMLIKLRPQNMCGSYFDIVLESAREGTP
jgi:hypothetical protein